MGFLFPMTGVTFPFTYIPNLLITAKAFPLRKSCRPWSLYGAIMVQSVFPDIRIGLYGSRRVADFLPECLPE